MTLPLHEESGPVEGDTITAPGLCISSFANLLHSGGIIKQLDTITISQLSHNSATDI